MDPFELQQYERIKSLRFLISDALSRADDGLEHENFDRDTWGYAYIQLARAKGELDELLRTVLTVRKRRMLLDGEEYTSPGA